MPGTLLGILFIHLTDPVPKPIPLRFVTLISELIQ
jgi:hypothetical protein